MTMKKITGLIDQARLEEASSHTLQNHLTQLTKNLHSSIQLPKENAGEKLLGFVGQYIDHVTHFLKEMEKSARKEDQRERYLIPVLGISYAFFLAPPDLADKLPGLEKIMLSAYLSERLIEEINDHCTRSQFEPLLPIDMTTANLIIHNIIGEPLANDLDQFTETIAKQILVAAPKYDDTQSSSQLPEPTTHHASLDNKLLHWSETFLEKEISLDFDVITTRKLM